MFGKEVYTCPIGHRHLNKKVGRENMWKRLIDWLYEEPPAAVVKSLAAQKSKRRMPQRTTLKRQLFLMQLWSAWQRLIDWLHDVERATQPLEIKKEPAKLIFPVRRPMKILKKREGDPLLRSLTIIIMNMQPIAEVGGNYSKEKIGAIINNQITLIDRCAHAGVPVLIMENIGGDPTIAEIRGQLGKKLPPGKIAIIPYSDNVLGMPAIEQLEKWGTETVIVAGVDANGSVKLIANQLKGEGVKIISSPKLMANPGGIEVDRLWFESAGRFCENFADIFNPPLEKDTEEAAGNGGLKTTGLEPPLKTEPVAAGQA